MCGFFVLDLVFQYCAGKNVSEMTYFVSGGCEILAQSISQ